ncbi:hypothetical protein [Acetobacter malorum]|uniref:hypothetical protein n=1 Tax=Acetobacter malorum TaxID=178901 RepID=UPI00248ED764|nr:hypothetical protein [Acetobacter malorum]
MELKFISVDDDGNENRYLFSIYLNDSEAHSFLLRTNGGSIVIPKIFHNVQDDFIVEGSDWSNSSRIRIDSDQKGIDLVFPIKNIYLEILESYAREMKGGPVSSQDIKNFLEKGIKALIYA